MWTPAAQSSTIVCLACSVGNPSTHWCVPVALGVYIARDFAREAVLVSGMCLDLFGRGENGRKDAKERWTNWLDSGKYTGKHFLQHLLTSQPCVGATVSPSHCLLFTDWRHVQTNVMNEFASRVCTSADSLSEFTRDFGQPVPSDPKRLSLNKKVSHESVLTFPCPVSMSGPLLTGVREALAGCKQAEWAHLGVGVGLKPTVQPPPTQLYTRTQCGALLNHLQQWIHTKADAAVTDLFKMAWPEKISKGETGIGIIATKQ